MGVMTYDIVIALTGMVAAIAAFRAVFQISGGRVRYIGSVREGHGRHALAVSVDTMVPPDETIRTAIHQLRVAADRAASEVLAGIDEAALRMSLKEHRALVELARMEAARVLVLEAKMGPPRQEISKVFKYRLAQQVRIARELQRSLLPDDVGKYVFTRNRMVQDTIAGEHQRRLEALEERLRRLEEERSDKAWKELLEEDQASPTLPKLVH